MFLLLLLLLLLLHLLHTHTEKSAGNSHIHTHTHTGADEQTVSGHNIYAHFHCDFAAGFGCLLVFTRNLHSIFQFYVLGNGMTSLFMLCLLCRAFPPFPYIIAPSPDHCATLMLAIKWRNQLRKLKLMQAEAKCWHRFTCNCQPFFRCYSKFFFFFCGDWC